MTGNNATLPPFTPPNISDGGPGLPNIPPPDWYLRLKQKIEALRADIKGVAGSVGPRALNPAQLEQIQNSLQATGPNPLNLTALPGIPIQSPVARVLHGTRAQRLAKFQPRNYPVGTLFYEDDTGLLYEDQKFGSRQQQWIIIQPVVSPFAFGAAGDGTTDDTSALTQALSAASYLWLPQGYTFLSGKLTITTPFTLITGGGVLKAKTNLNDDLLFFDGSGNVNGSYFRVLGVTIDGNGLNQSSGTGACIALRNAAYAIVNDNLIQGAKGDGIRIENYNASSVADEVNILDNRVFSNARHGIYLVPVDGGGGFGRLGDHLICNNHVNYNGGSGIRGTWVTATLLTYNNVLTNTAHGMFLDAADRVEFIGNPCRNNGGNGIYVDENATFGRSNDITVALNSLHYNTADGLDVWHTDRCQIIGNYIGDTDFTAKTQYGIQLFQSTSVVIGNNIFFNFVHQALLNNGVPYRAWGNIGFTGGSEPMSGNQAALPVLTGNDTSFQYYVTDYAHLLQWGGNNWGWAPGDAGSGMMQLFEVDPSPTTGWHLYDGNNNVSYLKSDGTLGTVALPDLITGNNNAAYPKAGSPNSGPNNAIAPTFNGNFSGNNVTPTGNVSATFTGNAMGTHAHEAPVGDGGTTIYVTGSFGAGSSRTASTSVTGVSGGGSFTTRLTSANSAGTPTGNVSATFTGNPMSISGNISGNISADGEPRNIVRRPWFRQ